MDSEESDFYGDEETVAGLETRVTSFDVSRWCEENNAVQVNRRVKKEPLDSTKLHNPYAGVPYAWQLTETVDDFLARLPPETTEHSDRLPWIFICNPYIHRKDKCEAQNQRSRGNEDEAPEEESSRLDTLVEGGMERLNILLNFKQGINNTKKSMAAKARETDQEKKAAIQDILDLAHAFWRVVARATANNELGIAAKVAPWNPHNDPTGRKDRIVCVYTADFSDKADVTRILQKLRGLRLVETMGRPIYYKPDAFTYLGIASGNHWDVKASIYSSADLLLKSPSTRSQDKAIW
ncbi:DNA polymerase II large subunit-like protein [Colletotrichum tofieldiae]|uniref:DNA polymerase II large subunit-like protein n=1 Tax=Colletotrichum tofieldiae TaxID=708197 RepID=A0A166NR42_9PEZI|nr:DNA polymerase II large subunit-like protein [Colletotrichum tofieldiae]